MICVEPPGREPSVEKQSCVRQMLKCTHHVRPPSAGPKSMGMDPTPPSGIPPPDDPPSSAPAAAAVPRVSLPLSWFLTPLWASIKAVVRPTTAVTRRKEITVTQQLPRECFEKFMEPVQAGDAEKIKRDPTTGWLQPTRTTTALRHFEYEIAKGSVFDRLFPMQDQDPDPPKPRQRRAHAEQVVVQAGEEDVYEVEAIRQSRERKGRKEYLIKWEGWDEETNTWERASRIHPALVATFEGKPLPPPKQTKQPRQPSAPRLPRRGAGCARARLSTAEERRGGVPQTISMVCGRGRIHYKVPKDEKAMPTLTLVFFVLTMDRWGNITWPIDFTPTTRAALRKQARVLLQRMIDDPLNPVDATMAPALTAMGTDTIFQPAKRRRLVEVEEE